MVTIHTVSMYNTCKGMVMWLMPPLINFIFDRHLFVAAQLLMDVAVQDLTGADAIKTLLKDIWDIRQAKLRYTLEAPWINVVQLEVLML